MPLPDAEATAPSAPRELIAAYLNKQGMPLTNENYSLALKANAENPGTIPGLRNMEPIASPGDPGQPPAPRPRGGGGGGKKPDTRMQTGGEQRTERVRPTDPNSMTGGGSEIGNPQALIAEILLGGAGIGGAAAGRRAANANRPAGPAETVANSTEPKPRVNPWEGPAGVDPNAQLSTAIDRATGERGIADMPRTGPVAEPMPGVLPEMNARSRGAPVTIAPTRPGGPTAPATGTGIQPVPPDPESSIVNSILDRIRTLGGTAPRETGKMPTITVRPQRPPRL